MPAMAAKKTVSVDQISQDPHAELKFKPHDLEWYGAAYERLYLEKLQIDQNLRDLAAKLKPNNPIMH